MRQRFRVLTPLFALVLLLLGAPPANLDGAPASKEKIRIEFVNISFPATREKKSVSLAVYQGADPVLKSRFEAARREFEQGILKLNLAGGPTPELEEFFDKKAVGSWAAIAEIASLPPSLKAAALHNIANCHTVVRHYDRAYESAALAAAADPAQKRYAIERDGLRDGFYAKRRGFEPAVIQAPRLRLIEQPGFMTGIASEISLSPPQARITPVRTVKNAVGAIWVNDLKAYRVEYREQIELSPAPLVGALELRNQTERVVDCRGVVVQVSINGNPVGGPKELRWNGDPARVVPKGRAVATFLIANPTTLPASGSLVISIFDLPATVSATGAIEAKRNDTFGWSIQRVECALEVANRIVDEKITAEDARNEGHPVALKARHEALVFPEE